MNRFKTAAWLGWGRMVGLAFNWLGLAWLGFSGGGGLGVRGRLAGLPPPPKHTPQIAGCDVKFLWHFVCVCGAMALSVHGSVCGYKHDWAPAASNKDTVAMGFVRGTVMVDFHRHGRVEKNKCPRAWQYQCQTMKRLRTTAWLGWGRIGLAWPRRGWGIREIQPGGLGDKQGGLETGLAWLGFSGGGGRGQLAPSPPSTHLK